MNVSVPSVNQPKIADFNSEYFLYIVTINPVRIAIYSSPISGDNESVSSVGPYNRGHSVTIMPKTSRDGADS